MRKLLPRRGLSVPKVYNLTSKVKRGREEKRASLKRYIKSKGERLTNTRKKKSRVTKVRESKVQQCKRTTYV